MGQLKKPVLYSFRRCPYAIRARLALYYCGVQVELREVVLRDKPEELVALSRKATVPVLVLENGQVLDESLDIMDWALQQNDPDHWCYAEFPKAREQLTALIKQNDTDFKHWLDRYKYADRYPEQSKEDYRRQCEHFLAEIEQCLNSGHYLQGNRFGFSDAAIVPFIRQFSLVDKRWFAESQYLKIKCWLNTFIQSPLFAAVMNKYPQWHRGDMVTLFPEASTEPTII
ncbi:glutathione S-transferase [Endozoicomonas sp. Mp262]|uniref:glutathione S-transferase n=1 Tax=Endozoicomonas sp. Mp262 TaxID=2919499 RepID=UPI0021D938EC